MGGAGTRPDTREVEQARGPFMDQSPPSIPSWPWCVFARPGPLSIVDHGHRAVSEGEDPQTAPPPRLVAQRPDTELSEQSPAWLTKWLPEASGKTNAQVDFVSSLHPLHKTARIIQKYLGQQVSTNGHHISNLASSPLVLFFSEVDKHTRARLCIFR